MEGIEVVTLKVSWECEELDEKKEKLIEYLKTHAVYDEDGKVGVFSGNCHEAYRVLRPLIPQFDYISLDMVAYGIESGQDVFFRYEWELGELDEDEDMPENIVDILSWTELVYASEWFAEWANEHEEETAEWRSKHKEDGDDDYDFGADRWRNFTDEFPEALKEFHEYMEDL
jgi:hypothetical protein